MGGGGSKTFKDPLIELDGSLFTPQPCCNEKRLGHLYDVIIDPSLGPLGKGRGGEGKLKREGGPGFRLAWMGCHFQQKKTSGFERWERKLGARESGGGGG